MSKKLTKLFIFLSIAVLMLSFSVCTATEVEDAVLSSSSEENAVQETNIEEESRVHEGDLYLCGTDIVMDKLVDGNAYIFGTNVTITGQVNGNLFVCANTLKFDTNPNTPNYNCYIRYSIFACAKSIYYNAACNDLYAVANNIEMTYDSYVVRDAKIASADVIFKAAVGRDLNLACEKVSFGEGEEIPIVYGKINYSAPNEATIPEGVVENVEEQIHFKLIQEDEEEKTNLWTDIGIEFLAFVTTIVVVIALSKWLTPTLMNNVSCCRLSALSLLKYFGIGLLVLFITCIAFFILLITAIGWKLAVIMLLFLILAFLVSVAYFVAQIAMAIQNRMSKKNTAVFYLLLILVSTVLFGIRYVPFVGGFISFAVTFIALGMFFYAMLPHKKQKQVEETKQPIKEELQENNDTTNNKEKEN